MLFTCDGDATANATSGGVADGASGAGAGAEGAGAGADAAGAGAGAGSGGAGGGAGSAHAVDEADEASALLGLLPRLAGARQAPAHWNDY